MDDPGGALRNFASILKDDGTLMIVEFSAEDRYGDNLNPLGRISYAVSTTVCVPSSLAQEGRAVLGSKLA